MTALAYALEGTRPAAPIRFAPVEPITFDADVLEAFCRLEGAAAEEAIGSVLMEIEERLILAHWQAARGEWGGLRRSADTLTALGNRIGMRTLSRAAAAVTDCLANGDEAALAACTARLTRLGERDNLAEWRLDGDLGA